MALGGANRGTANSNASGTTIAITPTGTLAAWSMAVMVIATDNAGSGGGTQIITTTSVTDSQGNTWVRELGLIYDPGAASAGVEMAVFYSQLYKALTTSDSVTCTFNAAAVAKAATLTEITAAAGFTPARVSSFNNAGSASGAPTITTPSITSGDVVIGFGGAESADTWAGDADTTNGTWSTKQSNAGGTGTSGMSVVSQYKVTTGTATQTFNPTLTSADQMIGYFIVTETVPQWTMYQGGGYYG